MERMNSETQKDYWEFLPFRLDKANATLWRDNRVVPLRPKSFAALCFLIERRGQLVTKDELLSAVWRNRCVGEAVLKVCINELRQALGDDAQAPVYLITVARRGYRFAAPVTDVKPEHITEKPAVAPHRGMVTQQVRLPDRPRDSASQAANDLGKLQGERAPGCFPDRSLGIVSQCLAQLVDAAFFLTRPTQRFRHTALSNSFFFTSWPRRSIKNHNAAKLLGRNGTTRLSRQSVALALSNLKGKNSQ